MHAPMLSLTRTSETGRETSAAVVCAMAAGMILGRAGKIGIAFGFAIAVGWEMFRNKQPKVKSISADSAGGPSQSPASLSSFPICDLGCETMSRSEGRGETVWFALIEPMPAVPASPDEPCLPVSFFNEAPHPVELTEGASTPVKAAPEDVSTAQAEPSGHFTAGVLARMAASLKLVPVAPLENETPDAKSVTHEVAGELAKGGLRHCLTPKAPTEETIVP